MIFPKLINSNIIQSKGDILNGRANLRDALEIREGNQLHYNISNKIQSKQDPVLTSHRGWQATPKIPAKPFLKNS